MVKKLFFETFLSLLQKGFVFLANLILSILIVRNLPIEAVGKYNLYITVFGIAVSIFCLGLHIPHTKAIVQSKENLVRVNGNYVIVLGLCIVFNILMCLIPRNQFIHWGVGKYEILIIGVAASIQTILSLRNYDFIAIGKIGMYNIVEILTYLVTVILYVVIFYIFLGTENILIVTLCVYAIARFIVLLFEQYYIKSELVTTTVVEFEFFVKCVPIGITLYVADLLKSMVLKLDLFMINQLCTADVLGHYTMATTIIDILVAIPALFAMLLLPKLYGKEEKSNITIATVKLSLLIATISASGIFLFCEPLIRLLYGVSYEKVILYIKYLCPGLFFLSVITVLYSIFISIDKEYVLLISMGLGMIANFMINWWLIPLIGGVGAAIASNLSYGIVFILLMIKLILQLKEDHSIE